MKYLFWGYMAIWILLFVHSRMLSRRQRKLEKDFMHLLEAVKSAGKGKMVHGR